MRAGRELNKITFAFHLIGSFQNAKYYKCRIKCISDKVPLKWNMRKWRNEELRYDVWVITALSGVPSHPS